MRVLRTLVCVLATIVCLAQPVAAAEETWCDHRDLAGFLFDIAKPFLGKYIDNPEGLQNTITKLRILAQSKSNDELVAAGFTELAAAYGWSRIWTHCDVISPYITAVMYREVEGRREGFLPRVAEYCHERGDLPDDSVTALLNAFYRLEFTAEEEDAALVWLAEEIAAVRNLRREGASTAIPL